MELKDRLNQILNEFLFENRFYYEIITRLNKKFSYKVKSLSTKINNNSIDLYINPQFLSYKSDNEIKNLIEHEILHIVLKHNIRKRNLDKKIYDNASDIAVNEIMLKDIENSPNYEKFFKNEKNIEKQRNSEYYYFCLMNLIKNNKINYNDLNEIDNHIFFEEEIKEDNTKKLKIYKKEQILDKIVTDSLKKSYDCISSELLKKNLDFLYLEKNIYYKEKWNKILRKILRKNSYNYDYKNIQLKSSKKRPDKKRGFPYPSIRVTFNRTHNIFVVIDSSGSIQDNKILTINLNKKSKFINSFQLLINELNYLANNQININLIFSDEEILKPDKIIDLLNNNSFMDEVNHLKYLITKLRYNNKGYIENYNKTKYKYLIEFLNLIIKLKNNNLNIEGIGNGTSYIPAVSLIENIKPKPETIIYFTDLKDNGKLQKSSIPIIFVSTERNHIKYNWAKYIFIDEL